MLKKILVPALLLAATVSFASDASRFSSHLSAKGAVPPNGSNGQGIAKVFVERVGDGSLMVSGTIKLSNLAGRLLVYHLHDGVAGVNGPVIVNLVGGETFRVTVGSRTFVGFNLIIVDPGVSFLQKMRSGGIYVNIHTTAVPGGEIRGQLSKAGN